MRGSLVKRVLKNGDLRYHLAVRVGGKQVWRVAGSNKKAAERFQSEVVNDIHHGTYSKPKKTLFSVFGEYWLEKYAIGSVTPSTHRSYRSDILNHIYPHLGHYPISQITAKIVQEFLVSLVKSGSSKKTANNILMLLKKMLRCAVEWEDIRVNPAFSIKPFPVERKEADVLLPHEVALLLKDANEPFRTLFFVAAFTGMRRGEIVGLQWKDIDLVGSRIFVRRALYWLTKKEQCERKEPERWIFGPPKTKRSYRPILMTPLLKKTLLIHQGRSIANKLDLVFCNGNGNPLDPDNFIKREFHTALNRAGLRHIRFHDVRHTFASMLIHIEPNAKLIQSQLGHASIQTTIDTYGHLFPIDHAALGTKLDNFVFQLSNSSRTNQPDERQIIDNHDAKVILIEPAPANCKP